MDRPAFTTITTSPTSFCLDISLDDSLHTNVLIHAAAISHLRCAVLDLQLYINGAPGMQDPSHGHDSAR